MGFDSNIYRTTKLPDRHPNVDWEEDLGQEVEELLYFRKYYYLNSLVCDRIEGYDNTYSAF